LSGTLVFLQVEGGGRWIGKVVGGVFVALALFEECVTEPVLYNLQKRGRRRLELA
jgi:hypothetical protein